MAEASAQRWVAAVESIGEALRQDENSKQALLMRGRTYCCMRKWDLAAADFQHVLALFPEDKDAQAALDVVFIPHLPLPLTD